MSRDPFLALPAREDRFQVYGLTLAFLGLFVALYGSASALSAYVPWRLHVSFEFERAIPFVPYASAAYLSMDLLVGLSPFVLRDLRRILPMFTTLCVQTAIASVCFLLLPVETDFAPRHVGDGSAPLFQVADLLNLERNFLPSLHVGFAVTAALAYAERVGVVGKLAFGLWALGIAIATLLIHEHHLVDVIAGALLAWSVWRTVGARARRESFVSAVDVELLCLRNFVAFSRRHVRYLLIWVALIRASLPEYRKRRVLRTGFCFLQAVDDLLDGDRASDREPLEVVQELRMALERNAFGDDELSRLARAFRADILACGGPEALDKALSLIGVMELDRTRVLQRQLLDAGELRRHHHLTFRYSLDLLLIASAAELRADDIPELIDALGWCSTMRDLEDDLAQGLINIPQDVFERASRAATSPDTKLLLQTPVVHDWLCEELARVAPLLDRSDVRLAELSDRKGAAVLSLFARSIRRYAERRIPRKLSAARAAGVA